MYVVIFRAQVAEFDAEYSALAARLRELALRDFGCREFHAVCEGREEVALSYWDDLGQIRAWKAQADHVGAQALGAARWYTRYRVEIARIERSYGTPAPAGE
jgi:heme-degrading monooxygenase HmoA